MKHFTTYCCLFLLCMLPFAAFAQLEVKAMSYNIRLDLQSDGENRWDARKDKVAGLMNYYEADFIGCQEVQHHQLTYLLDNLKGYAVIGVGRDDGKEAGEYSCLFYKKEKFTLVKQATFWLSPTPDSVSFGWDAGYRRVCTYGLFRSKTTKQYFWVFNTHLDNTGKIARQRSVELILKKIGELNAKKYPVILSGDFNGLPEDAPIQYVSNVMQNTRSVSKMVYGAADTWEEFKFNAKPNGCIDYIFIAKDRRMSVAKFATLTDSYDMKYPSDHLPILATILITK